MFKKKKGKSIVETLDKELGFIGKYGMSIHTFRGGAIVGMEDMTGVARKDLARIPKPFIEDYLRENYVECEDCGCLVAKGKAFFVKEWNTHKNPYCKYCKPPYDEILLEYDEGKEVVVGYIRNGVKCDEKGKLLDKLNSNIL